MGNSASSSGTLSIVLDPPSTPNSVYIAGQTISGSVYAQSRSNVQAPVHVEAYITGKERTRVRYTETTTDSNGNSHTHTRYRNAERSIYRVSVNLGSVNVGAQAGAKFRFPFRVQLPPDLPSTMFCSRNGGHCEINYKFKAHVGGKHKVEQLLQVMSAPLSQQPVPNLIPPIIKDVNVCGCFNMGEITMGARIANTRIGRGETAIIDFACKNKSRTKIMRVEVDAKQEVRWIAGSHRERSKNVVSHKLFQRTERWGQMTKEEVKSLKKSSKNNTDTHRDRKQRTLQMIHTAIFDGENRVMLPMPSSALQSYQGALIQVEHRMKIKIHLDGMCMSNPTIKLPIHLGTPTSYLPASPAATVSTEPEIEIPVATAIAMPSAPPISATPSAPPLPLQPATYFPAPSAPPDEWAGAVTSAPVVVGNSTAIVGGANILEGAGDENNAFGQASVYMPVAEVVPTYNNLINEIKFACSPLDAVRKRLNEKIWEKVFTTMSPREYSSTIKAVAIEFDQPDMAALIAPKIKGGNFTHEYVIAAIRVVSDWLRTPTITKLLPMCKDLHVHANAGKIKSELTDWEKVCTERDFEEALRG